MFNKTLINLSAVSSTVFHRQPIKGRLDKHNDSCFPTEKLSRVIASVFRPDVNFDMDSEKELEVS